MGQREVVGTNTSMQPASYLAIELIAGLDPDVLALSEVEYGPGELDGAALPPLQAGRNRATAKVSVIRYKM